MMKLQEPAFGTSPECTDERTLAVVSSPHLAADHRRHVARVRVRATRGAALRRGHLGLLDPLEQYRQRSIEDHGHVAIGHAVSHQILHAGDEGYGRLALMCREPPHGGEQIGIRRAVNEGGVIISPTYHAIFQLSGNDEMT
jgi:hypothetical protein